jgi:hypothetical protein
MTRLLELIREHRRHSSAAEKITTYEVVDLNGNSIIPCLHKGTVHYRIHTGVCEPECDEQVA